MHAGQYYPRSALVLPVLFLIVCSLRLSRGEEAGSTPSAVSSDGAAQRSIQPAPSSVSPRGSRRRLASLARVRLRQVVQRLRAYRLRRWFRRRVREMSQLWPPTTMKGAVPLRR
jgi:hypothetical protein